MGLLHVSKVTGSNPVEELLSIRLLLTFKGWEMALGMLSSLSFLCLINYSTGKSNKVAPDMGREISHPIVSYLKCSLGNA